MDFAVFMDKIGLCPEGVALFNSLDQRMDDPAFRDAVDRGFQAFDAGDEACASFLTAFAAEQNVSVEEANLYLYFRLLSRTYEYYQEKGISDDVFYATMKTFAWHCGTCFESTGHYGIAQQTYREWYTRHIRGTLFRLGRLEFDITSSLYDFDLDGHHISKGDTCIYVHIPGGTPLDAEECDAAYDTARKFFKEYFRIDPVIFYSSSWLLHPWMQEILPESSRIVNFQKRFKLVEIVQDEPVIRRWLFARSEAPYDELPVTTSLHKAALFRLKNGLPIGYARGYHF